MSAENRAADSARSEATTENKSLEQAARLRAARSRSAVVVRDDAHPGRGGQFGCVVTVVVVFSTTPAGLRTTRCVEWRTGAAPPTGTLRRAVAGVRTTSFSTVATVVVAGAGRFRRAAGRVGR